MAQDDNDHHHHHHTYSLKGHGSSDSVDNYVPVSFQRAVCPARQHLIQESMSGDATPVNAELDDLPLADHADLSDIPKKPQYDAEAQRASPQGNGKVGFRDRVQHVTWAAFTTTMSTGGLALVLSVTPHQFDGLEVIGRTVYIFNLCLFVTLCAAIATRFVLCPQALKNSLLDQTESFFFSAFWLTVATIISGAQKYGVPHSGPWLVTAIRVLFWLYAACTITVAVTLHYFLFTVTALRGAFRPDTMNPTWLFPMFPAMLTGTISSIIAADQPPHHRMPIIIAGITCQGMGWMVSFAITTIYLYRCFHTGFIPPAVRPGMFMMVGAPSFTALALYGNAQAIPDDYAYFAAHPLAPEVLRILALWIAVFLWAFAAWLWCLAVAGCVFGAVGVAAERRREKRTGREEAEDQGKGGKMRYSQVWWAMVFPNVGFTVATADIGVAFESQGVEWVASAMTIVLAAAWCFVACAMARGVWRGYVWWPGRDEDRGEPQCEVKRE